MPASRCKEGARTRHGRFLAGRSVTRDSYAMTDPQRAEVRAQSGAWRENTPRGQRGRHTYHLCRFSTCTLVRLRAVDNTPLRGGNTRPSERRREAQFRWLWIARGEVSMVRRCTKGSTPKQDLASQKGPDFANCLLCAPPPSNRNEKEPPNPLTAHHSREPPDAASGLLRRRVARVMQGGGGPLGRPPQPAGTWNSSAPTLTGSHHQSNVGGGEDWRPASSSRAQSSAGTMHTARGSQSGASEVSGGGSEVRRANTS